MEVGLLVKSLRDFSYIAVKDSMADNTQHIQPQAAQQPAQPSDRPVREFIQVDTSTNAFMEKSDKNVSLSSNQLKDN